VAFATPSLTLNRYRFGPLRSSRLALVTLEHKNKRTTPFSLRFTFKERTICRNRPRGFPSYEIHSLTPLHRHPMLESTPRTCKQVPSAQRQPDVRSCSIPVVSHHLDGFLLVHNCGFIAPRYRSWGSSCFPRPASSQSEENRNSPQNVGFHTLLRIPLASSVLRLHSLYLLDIYTRIIADFLPVRQFPANSRMNNFIPKE